MTAEEVIRLLTLEPLPDEGGYFRRTYASKGMIPAALLPGSDGERPYSTAIYYLVTPDDFSALHLLPYDEMYHFYLGDPVEMIQIDETGTLSTFILGSDLARGQRPQVLAPGRLWQGTRLISGGRWALLGTTVAPGFDYRDFTLGRRDELTRKFPQHADTLRNYTRS